MRPLHMAIVGAVFAAAFSISNVARGNVLPGIVGGVLGGILVYLVLLRVQQHNEALRRRRRGGDEG
jgi:asparagine N-glycosylation enzyme membrane subunit Stt3